MIVRAVDAMNDWMFGKGRNDYKSNSQAINQNIQTRLQSFLGDCFFDISAGLDWFNLLGSKNQLALELAVSAIIFNTEGVVGIVSLVIDLDEETRGITMSYVVNTIFTQALNENAVVGGVNLLTTEDGDILITEDGDAIAVG